MLEEWGVLSSYKGTDWNCCLYKKGTHGCTEESFLRNPDAAHQINEARICSDRI